MASKSITFSEKTREGVRKDGLLCIGFLGVVLGLMGRVRGERGGSLSLQKDVKRRGFQGEPWFP